MLGGLQNSWTASTTRCRLGPCSCGKWTGSRQTLSNKQPASCPLFNPKNKHTWFVIDGQQRLSVIYQAFKAEERENDAGRPIDFSRLCFVVNSDPEEANPARIVYKKPVDRELVPLHDHPLTGLEDKDAEPSQVVLNEN